MRPRRLVGASVRPLNFTVRGQPVPLPKRETREILGDGGKVLATAEYLGDLLDGVSRVFSTAGVLTQELTYRAGQLHGSYRTWWDNGQPKESGSYDTGRRIGLYRWYKDDGTLWQEHDYGAAL
jgi:antitoxin component YwqK of YwqJK toxin-antitoxin module